MSKVKIYHNPRCSKSRATLVLLEEKGIKADIILYLDQPPSPETLAEILDQLGMKPRELLRKKESEYKLHQLNDESLSDAQLITTMCRFPRLIERPIVVNNGKAAIGRPPEKVLEIL